MWHWHEGDVFEVCGGDFGEVEVWELNIRDIDILGEDEVGGSKEEEREGVHYVVDVGG